MHNNGYDILLRSDHYSAELHIEKKLSKQILQILSVTTREIGVRIFISALFSPTPATLFGYPSPNFTLPDEQIRTGKIMSTHVYSFLLLLVCKRTRSTLTIDRETPSQMPCTGMEIDLYC